MQSEDIKKQRNTFRQEREHAVLPPASLVAAKDSTALFNVAWMQQLIPYLMGKPHQSGKRLYNIQGCVRTNDIEDIGDERHLSYFDMMGNWSLGDYFKEESITRSVEFLHGVLWIPKERIGATIFAWSEKRWIARDIVAEEVLKKMGITHITALWVDENDDSDNFWIAGSEGPCGPCCEFYIDRGVDGQLYYDPVNGAEMQSDWSLGVNDRYTEVWNNVFMEFYKNKDGSVTKLPQQNVDTGMGFERICMILQNKETIFETDIFAGIIPQIENFISAQFNEPRLYPAYHKAWKDMSDFDKTYTRSYRIVTDHIRTASVLLQEWVLPSNEGRGYVVRRLIRRMYYHLQKMWLDTKIWQNTEEQLNTFFGPIVSSIIARKTDASKTTTAKTDSTLYALVKECLQFQDTIRKWQKILDQWFQKAKQADNILSWDFVFQAYDTYGLPVELMQEVAEQQWLTVDMDSYHKAMEAARSKSRDATKQKFSKWTDRSMYISDLPATQYTGYNTTDYSDMKLLKDIVIDGQRILIFDQTPFYAEGGGEASDTWIVTLDDWNSFKVLDVQKTGWVYIHFVEPLDL